MESVLKREKIYMFFLFFFWAYRQLEGPSWDIQSKQNISECMIIWSNKSNQKVKPWHYRIQRGEARRTEAYTRVQPTEQTGPGWTNTGSWGYTSWPRRTVYDPSEHSPWAGPGDPNWPSRRRRWPGTGAFLQVRWESKITCMRTKTSNGSLSSHRVRGMKP